MFGYLQSPFLSIFSLRRLDDLNLGCFMVVHHSRWILEWVRL
jgi:hypothetical protein